MIVKTSLIAAGFVLASGGAFATEFGNVISSTPVTGSVPVSQQQCVDQQQVVPRGTTRGGAVAGAIIGGVAGNAMGAGRGAATAIGAVTGAIIGNGIEAANTPPATVPVRTCGAVTAYQNQVIGYDVVYEYNGQTYSARVAQPPGARIALQVMPADAQAPGVDAPPPAAPPVAVYSQPVSPYPPTLPTRHRTPTCHTPSCGRTATFPIPTTTPGPEPWSVRGGVGAAATGTDRAVCFGITCWRLLLRTPLRG
jgi:uncharacterized protein YcfJ